MAPTVITPKSTECFWKHTRKGGADECWEYQACRTRAGYGQMPGWIYTHRYSWVLHNEKPIPAGFHVCHSCDNPPCVNPAHLWLGTDADNIRDMIAKGRHVNAMAERSHCKNGHPLSGPNLVVLLYHRNGKTRPFRGCRECRRVGLIKSRQRRAS